MSAFKETIGNRGFIFDMDGTLIDSIRIWFQAEQIILDQEHIELTKKERDDLNTLTLEEAGTFFHERFGLMGSGEEVVTSIVEHMLNSYRTSVNANPGARDFVQAIADSGARLCVLSSSPQSFIQAGLTHTDMKRFFRDDLLVSAEDSGMAKRKHSTFERICEMLGTTPENTWLFDDSWYACKTAREVGLNVVGVYSMDGCGTHEELAKYCDRVVDSFEELDPADYIE